MMGLVAVFIAKLLDPIGGIIALVLGAIAPPRIMILVGAVAGAIITEFMLQSMQYTRYFSIGIFLVGIVALSVWAAVGNIFVRKWLRKGDAK